jgi:hypothetical protein
MFWGFEENFRPGSKVAPKTPMAIPLKYSVHSTMFLKVEKIPNLVINALEKSIHTESFISNFK